MLRATLPLLRCPACAGAFSAPDSGDGDEIRSGSLVCESCGSRYPVLAGVAILVRDVEAYLAEHVKGIARNVEDDEIPEGFRERYLEAKDEIEEGHIEEDLESRRVVALYLMNHYLRGEEAAVGVSSPLLSGLIREHWDRGPFVRIAEWARDLSGDLGRGVDAIELGCGVGGLERALGPFARSALGVDSSFASVLLARHLNLGTPCADSTLVPDDLLNGPVSRAVTIPRAETADGSVDFVVGEFEALPAARERFDLSIALNAIDMMPDPSLLPRLQKELLRARGTAIQGCPYIWHEHVASDLRDLLPEGTRDSAAAVEWLYGQAGFRVDERVAHVPWLFLKHARQLELYSVHLFRARKTP